MPQSYKLFQNYPNPFNPATKISFEIPREGNVSLKIYDTLGTEVTTLVDEHRPAGNYNVEFNAGITDKRSLSSGIYFYSLIVNNSSGLNDFVEAKKFVLLK